MARFYQQVKAGDIVVARRGHEVFCLGIVVDDTVHHDARFDDIHGWDVSHYRRVAWNTKKTAQILNLQKQKSFFSHLRSVPTLNRADATVKKHVDDFIRHCEVRDLAELPTEPSEILDFTQLAGKLFDRGVSHSDVSNVCKTIERVHNLILNQAYVC